MSRKVAADSSATHTQNPGQDARSRELLDFLRRYEAAFRATARRFSRSGEDAEDALQRSIEILLTQAPAMNERSRCAWMHVVVRHEALRVRRQQQRQAQPSGESDRLPEGAGVLPLEGLRPEATDPAELFERRDEAERFRQAFGRLKPDERRALALISEGYSYLEIGELTGWSRTKINRLLAEGRAAMRKMLGHLDSGQRCAELAGPLSRLSDGEASEREERELRQHLSSCMACRATMRSYRLTTGAAGMFLPLGPTAGAVSGRLQELAAWLQSKLPGRGSLSEAVISMPAASGSGSGQSGLAALAKVAIICAGAGGGTAACVAAGVLPAPSLPAIERSTEKDQPSDAGETDGEQGQPVPVFAPPPPPAPAEQHDPASARKREQDTDANENRETEPVVRRPEQAEFGVEAAGSPVRIPRADPAETSARVSAGTPGSSESSVTSARPAPRPSGGSTEARPPLGNSSEFAP